MLYLELPSFSTLPSSRVSKNKKINRKLGIFYPQVKKCEEITCAFDTVRRRCSGHAMNQTVSRGCITTKPRIWPEACECRICISPSGCWNVLSPSMLIFSFQCLWIICNQFFTNHCLGITNQIENTKTSKYIFYHPLLFMLRPFILQTMQTSSSCNYRMQTGNIQA